MTTLISNLSPGSASSFFERWRQAWLRLPRRPAPRSAAQEAAEVRELAHHYRKSDPGFASDLFAAADRHEREPGSTSGR